MPSYFGIGDKARGANKIYLGVDGVAREVKKMYLGVNGKARLIYPNNTWKKYTTNEIVTYYWEKWNVVTTYRFNMKTKLRETQNYSLRSINNGYWSRRAVSMDPGGDEYTFDKSTGLFTLNPDKTVYSRVWDNATHGAHTIYGPNYRYICIIGTYSRLNITSVYDPPEDEFENAEYDYTINGTFTSRSGSSLVKFYASSYVNSVGIFAIYEYTSIVDTTSKGSTSYGSVSGSIRNQYPDNGSKDGYWYVYDRSETSYSQGSYIEDVYSANPNAYPTNGKHTDGYWYVKQ